MAEEEKLQRNRAYREIDSIRYHLDSLHSTKVDKVLKRKAISRAATRIFTRVLFNRILAVILALSLLTGAFIPIIASNNDEIPPDITIINVYSLKNIIKSIV